jgi:hypothetical protein
MLMMGRSDYVRNISVPSAEVMHRRMRWQDEYKRLTEQDLERYDHDLFTEKYIGKKTMFSLNIVFQHSVALRYDL